MTSLHAPSHTARVVLGTLAALALLAAMSAVAAGEPVTSDHFAPGWQTRARALYDLGPSRDADRTKWYVPPILPRGEYVVVERKGDTAELIEGVRFTVRGGNSEQYLFVAPGYNNVEALPVADVPSLKPRAAKGEAALR